MLSWVITATQWRQIGPIRLERYGSVKLWRDTLRDFTSINLQLPGQVAALALQMQQAGLALEQESVWLKL